MQGSAGAEGARPRISLAFNDRHRIHGRSVRNFSVNCELFRSATNGRYNMRPVGRGGPVIRTVNASLILIVLLMGSAAVGAQTINTLTAREKADGWQLLFDGKTLDGWHSSPGAPGGGRATPPPPPQPGTLPQVGSAPKPCATTSARSNVPAGGSHWEVGEGLLTAGGEPAGYLTSDRSYKDFVLSIEFKTGEDTNSGVFVRSPM